MTTVSAADFSPSLDISAQRVAFDPESRRIAVRIANWDDVHSGFGAKVRMPRNVNVEAAHVGQALLDDGSTMRVATLPMDTMHAPKNLDAMHAASWYENTGKGVARVRYSTDEHGLRADGVLFDDVTDDQLERLTAAAPSGDWRSAIAVRKPTDFEHTPADLVGACIVNIPGFADSYSQSAGQKYALAASANSLISFDEDLAEALSATDEYILDVVTAAADSRDSESDDCDPDCKDCKCKKKGSYMSASAEDGANTTISELENLRAAATEEIERIDALIAAGSYQIDGKAMSEHQAAMAALEQRIANLEQLVADALLSM